jgi:hypothetical protein
LNNNKKIIKNYKKLVQVTVRSGLIHDPAHATVQSTGPHGTGPYGPVLGERRTGPPLDRTVAGPRVGTGLGMVRSAGTDPSETGWTGWVFPIHYMQLCKKTIDLVIKMAPCHIRIVKKKLMINLPALIQD